MKKQILTASSLQNELWDTLKQLKSGTIKPLEANAISAQAREICRVTQLQIEISRLSKTKPKRTELLIK